MTRMTRPDCAVMCNLINTRTHTERQNLLMACLLFVVSAYCRFPRKFDGSSLPATRVLPGGNANARLATFVEHPSHRSDGPPSPLPNRSIASPVAHQNKSGVSNNSCRTTSNAVGCQPEKHFIYTVVTRCCFLHINRSGINHTQ